MYQTALFVSCPYCATQTVIDCGHISDRERRLKGTDLSCTHCNNEFELYYY